MKILYNIFLKYHDYFNLLKIFYIFRNSQLQMFMPDEIKEADKKFNPLIQNRSTNKARSKTVVLSKEKLKEKAQKIEI
jgi:hypothetical protein